MAYNVKVIKKEDDKVGKSQKGEYRYTSLTIDYEGKISERKILSTSFQRYPDLKGELEKVKDGMTIGIETQQNGNYKEISKIVLSPITHSKTIIPSESRDISIQVMNAMNNACQTLGEGMVTVNQIEQRSWELVLLGERLKKRLADGDHLKDNISPPNDPSVNTGSYEEEEVPF
jgi:hypothetical protein